MTDTLAALTPTPTPPRTEALAPFHASYPPLVPDQRFALQAASPRPETLADIQTLAHHPDLGLHTPNRARAPVGTVANTNPAHVHTKSGEGYRLLANTLIAIDSFNAQTAAPTCSRFTAEKARLTLE